MTYISAKKTLSLSGQIQLPSSKSQCIRSLLFALLAKGESTLHNVLNSDDTHTAQAVCEALGARIQVNQGTLTICSQGLPLNSAEQSIYTHNSGITTSFTLPLLGLRQNCMDPIQLDCGQQMRQRPIQGLVDALCTLGMHIYYCGENARLPISITGQLQGGTVEIDGLNSQYLSALLISLPCAQNDSVIKVINLHERPYVDMTLAYLQQQGIDYRHKTKNNMDIFYIRGRQCYQPTHQTIKGDFSSASCLIAACTMITSDVEIHGLDLTDTQGDKRLLTILHEMGANINIDKEKIKINSSAALKGIRIDAKDIPDLVPALAVIGTQASGKTEITNVLQARIKETDRIHSMTEGLRRMGARIEEQADGMTIYPSKLHGALVNGYNDHRTVMALTIAGMIADGTTLISDGAAINKTYPDFVENLKGLGANIALTAYNEKNNHIILIGFKHVGKTLIGQQLAKTLNKTFVDLDDELEKLYQKNNLANLNCREIMQTHGDAFYRNLETTVLKNILTSTNRVVSLGGGTLSRLDNQAAIKQHVLLHVIAPRGIVFERIMVEGRPAFFDPNEDPYESFSRLWEERNQVYKKLTTRIVNNCSTIEHAVHEAMTLLATAEDFQYA